MSVINSSISINRFSARTLRRNSHPATWDDPTRYYGYHDGWGKTEYFDPAQYSRFKHGSKSIAREYGTELARRFVLESTWLHIHSIALTNKPAVVYAAPYNFVPTATYALKDYFIAQYNETAIDTYGVLPAQEGKIFRGHSYNQDYGEMTAAERDAAISGDEFYIDKEFAKGKVLIFIDDIRVSGSHERRMLKMLENFDMLDSDFIFLYYASVEKPGQDEINPKVENTFNYADVKCLRDIDHIIKNDEYTFNTRMIKYILNQPMDEFKPFIMYQSDTFRSTMLHYAYGNSYHKLPEFSANMKLLRQWVHNPPRHE